MNNSRRKRLHKAILEIDEARKTIEINDKEKELASMNEDLKNIRDNIVDVIEN